MMRNTNQSGLVGNTLLLLLVSGLLLLWSQVDCASLHCACVPLTFQTRYAIPERRLGGGAVQLQCRFALRSADWSDPELVGGT
jgi:hypothetical protein